MHQIDVRLYIQKKEDRQNIERVFVYAIATPGNNDNKKKPQRNARRTKRKKKSFFYYVGRLKFIAFANRMYALLYR